MPTNPTEPASVIGADRQSKRFLILLGIFVISLILVVGLKMFFSNLYDQLGERSSNERARLFIGEQIVNTLLQIEKDVYHMTTLNNVAAQARLEDHILGHIETMRHDLKVLKEGGVVKNVVNLNIDGHEQMVRQVTYHPDPGNQSYIMELIEIAPLLDQLPPKTKELLSLLDRRITLRESGDREALFAAEQDVATYLKRIPPYFFRLNENANRLFYESSNRLLELENELTKQRQRFKQTELVLVLLILGLSTLAGWYYARQISLANRRMETALDEMRQAKEEAERASRSKSEFVSRMSHELRTPMNAILGFAQLLEEEELPEEHRDYVGEINRAGGHLLELINQVLDLAKIEAGHMTLEAIEFDLRRTLDDVAGIVAERARKKGLQLLFHAAPDLPSRIIGDPTRLRQVLINLMGNAEKFTAQGSIEIRVEAEHAPADPDHPQRISFSVKDTGIGMDAPTLARLFKPFAQADESMTRRFGGTGLGLTISKDLIQAMGGTLEVESTPGIGSRFWFTLPARPAPEHPGQPTLPSAPPARIHRTNAAEPTTNTSPIAKAHTDALHAHVLLVEDNRINQMVACRMLEKLGVTCDIANHGSEALQRLATTDYDLVLMDMEMPEMDGLEASRQIRANEIAAGTRRIPIVAMTANAMTEDKARCLASGMDDYLSKPVAMDALKKIMEHWLNQPTA